MDTYGTMITHITVDIGPDMGDNEIFGLVTHMGPELKVRGVQPNNQ